MRALFCKDTLLRPFRSMRGDPDRWISRLVFLLGPWAALWMVEILNENDVFQDLAAWLSEKWLYKPFFGEKAYFAPYNIILYQIRENYKF